MRLIAVFNLKPGIAPADYEAWAKAQDLPTVNGLPSVTSFRVFKTCGRMGSGDPAPYSYIEILDIADMEQFGRDVSTETMQAIAATFTAMADVIFMPTEELT